jgi:diguanylate cyclase (GGDEF)-like protein
MDWVLKDEVILRLNALVQNIPCQMLETSALAGEDLAFVQSFNKLIGDLQEMREVALELASGHPVGKIPSRRNYIAAPLKMLQSRMAGMATSLELLSQGRMVNKLSGTGSLHIAFNHAVEGYLSLSSKIDVNGQGASALAQEPIKAQNRVNSWRFHQIVLALDNIHAMVLETNAKGEIVYANRPAADFFRGVRTIDEATAAQDVTSILGQLRKHRKGDVFPIYEELLDARNNCWYKVTTEQFSLIAGEILFVHMIDDITNRKRYEAELATTASFDALTGAYNRRAGIEKLRRALTRVKSGDINCVAFFDIDNLKQINDDYSHQDGDYAISTIAACALESVRQSDILVRYGGDEFILFFLSCNYEAAEKRMAQIESKLTACNAENKHPYTLSFSYGLYPFQYTNDLQIPEVLDRADKIMYARKRAKKAGLPLPTSYDEVIAQQQDSFALEK